MLTGTGHGAGRRALVAAGAGLSAAVALAVGTGIDTRLVAAYRAGRTGPYRAAFFTLLFAFCFFTIRRAVRAARHVSLGKALLMGAISGYVSGFLTYWLMQLVFISAEGAWKALVQLPNGFDAPLLVPVLTFSWLMGALAFLCASVVLHAQEKKSG